MIATSWDVRRRLGIGHVTAPNRDAIFISHASPDDNAFIVWLGLRLTAVGYEVWADVLRPCGGQDWQRLLDAMLLH